MKFSEAWANVAKLNVNLKVAVLSLSACTLFMGFALVKLSLADPIVIERSCYSKNLEVANANPSEEEIKVFVQLALDQRFTTNVEAIEGYLSDDELKAKLKEQNVLNEKSLLQFIIVRDINVHNDSVLVEADRYYSVKNVRSGFPIQLKLTIESKSRTSTNPYGLILTQTEEIKNKKDGEE